VCEEAIVIPLACLRRCDRGRVGPARTQDEGIKKKRRRDSKRTTAIQ
jgi:hypothetical protein